MDNKSILNDRELRQVNGGAQDLLPKDRCGSIILNTSEHDAQILQTYRKDIGSDKNAKVMLR